MLRPYDHLLMIIKCCLPMIIKCCLLMIIKCCLLMIIKCFVLMIIIMSRPYDHLVTMLSMVIMVIFLSYFEVDCDDLCFSYKLQNELNKF